MLEAQHFTATAERKGSYVLPEEFDGSVNEAALYYAVRAFRANQRRGTHATKTRAEVSGGSRKPWRQKGTGRARQGSIRSPQWTGGGIVFGPRPRSYRTALPKKVKRLARQSALNTRAAAGQIYVIEALEFDEPKTRRLADLLGKLDLAERKVLVLTGEGRRAVYLSGRNLPRVEVRRYVDASPYDILWADALVVEEGAIGGRAIEGTARKATAGRAKRAKKASEGTTRKRTTRAVSKRKAKTKKKATARTKKAKKTTGKKKRGS